MTQSAGDARPGNITSAPRRISHRGFLRLSRSFEAIRAVFLTMRYKFGTKQLNRDCKPALLHPLEGKLERTPVPERDQLSYFFNSLRVSLGQHERISAHVGFLVKRPHTVGSNPRATQQILGVIAGCPIAAPQTPQPHNGIGDRSQKSNKMTSEEEAPAATIRTAGAPRPERALRLWGPHFYP